MRGSQHNDPFVVKTAADGKKRLGTSTNHSGGVQGGITNGEHIVFRVPTSTHLTPPFSLYPHAHWGGGARPSADRILTVSPLWVCVWGRGTGCVQASGHDRAAAKDMRVWRQRDGPRSPRKARSVRRAARRTHRRGHGSAGHCRRRAASTRQTLLGHRPEAPRRLGDLVPPPPCDGKRSAVAMEWRRCVCVRARAAVSWRMWAPSVFLSDKLAEAFILPYLGRSGKRVWRRQRRVMAPTSEFALGPTVALATMAG